MIYSCFGVLPFFNHRFAKEIAMSFFTSTSFIFSFGLLLVIIVAGVRVSNLSYIPAGSKKHLSGATLTRMVTLGLIMMLAAFLMLYTLQHYDHNTSLKNLFGDTLTKCVPPEPTAPVEKGRYTPLEPMC